MFTHVMVGANDVDKSEKFYTAILGTLGIPAGQKVPNGSVFYATPTGAFGVGRPRNGEAASFANGGTIGFKAESAEHVKAFHAAGLANGGTCEGEPGHRAAAPGAENCGAYLRDPDGNKVCAFWAKPE
jgi:catechol 2,3-dioxygenase-like lactoylglutathione lyase family enzyme